MMDTSFMIPIGSDEARHTLAGITTIYTDLDGTLLAPGGKLTTNFAGEPSTAIVEALVAVKRAGIRLVVVTGRSRIQGNEFIRMLDADAFIGEMGTTLQLRDTGPLMSSTPSRGRRATTERRARGTRHRRNRHVRGRDGR